MKRTVVYAGKTISYELTYKKVKNINLRIKPDGSIIVSAGRWVSQSEIDDFVVSKGEFILNALNKFSNNAAKPLLQHYKEEEIRDVIMEICKNVYPYYEKKGIDFPQIKFRKMVSRWGSCHPTKKILTFNIYLMYVPRECIEYVVYHEFTHFLQANHSRRFYDELCVVCPDWKRYRNILKGVNLRGK